jgi:hypothetical protein
VVWVKRWATDTRAEIDGAGMVDPRVTHLWDAGNVINQEFLDRFGVDFGGLDYDFFLLFDRNATWQQHPPPAGQLRCHRDRQQRPAGRRRGAAAALITALVSLAILVVIEATTGARTAQLVAGVGLRARPRRPPSTGNL